MASLKFAFAVLLAFSAVQCQAASASEPVPKNADIFLAAQHAIKIIKNIIGSVEKGIQDSKPSVDVILQQLTPEAGKAMKKVLDDALNLAKKERERIEFMIKEMEDLLKAVNNIKSCTDSEKKNIEKLLANLENGILAGVRAAMKTHGAALENLKIGFKRILDKTRKLFDTEIVNVMGCIKPGNPNAQKCVQDVLNNIKSGVMGLATDFLLYASEVKEVIPVFGLDVLKKIEPSIQAFKKDSGPIMKKISDCIAKMK